MEKLETYEEIKKYVESLKENETIQIYNQKTSKLTSYIIQFRQLISYLNFKSKLKEKLSNPDTENLRLKDIYLIDKRWFNSWKKHVGYESAEKFYNNYKFREELNDSDYDTIYSIINNNSSNCLFPLDNERLYNNNEAECERQRNEIVELYVDHFFEDQGIGTALIEFAIENFGVTYLWALEKNTDAIRFYERNGFHLTDKHKLENGTVEYLVMMKRDVYDSQE